MLPELKHFVQILPEPCFLLTAKGNIVLANTAAAELTHINHAELPGKPFTGLLQDRHDQFTDYLKYCARSRQLIPGSVSFKQPGAAPLEIRCDGTVLESATETAEGLIFIRCRPKAEATDQFVLLNQKIAALSREAIERKKAEQQRDELLQSERAARVEAERNSRMKDEFLATLSHELRTPLNAILGWTSLLERETLPPEAAEGVEVIARNARSQKQLIEDLLDMSRIISGKIRLDVQRVELATVIESAVATIRPAAEAKGVRLQVTLDPIAGPVKGDPGRLQQVVWNLLSNAVKFTPKGGRVQVSLERVNSHLEIVIADTGDGIKPEFLPHVFDRFQQADSSTTRKYGGLGLGLSIVKQIVELHGGTVKAKSPGEGKGSTFIVVMPLMLLHEGDENGTQYPRVHPAGTLHNDPDPCEMQDLAGVSVLVVDDEADARELVQKLLHTCHANVFTAAGSDDAMKILATERLDVVISDIGMPEADGYAFIRKVRAKTANEGGRVPAIALTAFARAEDRMRAMLAGYNLHLSKPIEPTELIVAVASLAGRTGNRPAPEPPH
jgi:signal transduction histidine kinase/ActR/RegA family two-component response regulator